jgi:hypothetical protein
MALPNDPEDRKQFLEDSIDSLGNWLIVSTVVVVIGLSIELYHPLRVLMHKYDWWVMLEVTGSGLVAIGVAGELFVEFWAHRQEHKLRLVNSEIEAASQRKLKAADERIAEYAARVKEAEASIAIAGKDAAQARLELAKLKAPRRIDPEHIPAYISLLSNFAGQKYTLSVSSDPDAMDLLKSIDGILTSSKWIWTKPIGQIMMGDRANSVTAKGIILRYASDKWPDFQGAVLALFSAFKAEQFDVSFGIDPTLETAAELNIVVGTKPL